MAKASPGGILLMGIGGFLIAVGFTDRLSAVWEALRTGATDGTGSGTAPGDGQTTIPGTDIPVPGSGPKDSGDPQYPRVGVHCTGGGEFQYRNDAGCSRSKTRVQNCNDDEYCSDQGTQSLMQHCIKKSCTKQGNQSQGGGCSPRLANGQCPPGKTLLPGPGQDGPAPCCPNMGGQAYVTRGVNGMAKITNRANYTPFGR